MIIWIFQSGEPLHSDDNSPRPMRAMNLANKLIDRGHKVVLWSSAFSHQSKMHRSTKYEDILISENLRIKLIPSSGYKKNISISRFYDHCILAWNLHKKLKLEKIPPDVAFIGYPPIEAAYVMSSWLKNNNVPFLLDVKDQWPNILVKSFPRPLRLFARCLLSPYYFLAKKSMKNATGISAHVPGFVKWALKFSNKIESKNDVAFPLTTPQYKIGKDDLSRATDWWSDQGIIKNNYFRVIFIGSFARSFNFDDIFLAAHELSSQKIDCEFVLCGDGDKNNELRAKAKLHDNVKIISWIDGPKIKALSNMSDAAIAPYKNKSDFTISIPNKVIDSLMLGLPLLSSLEGEVEALIKKYNIGYFYNESIPLSDCIKKMKSMDISDNHLSKNAKDLYCSKFEFNKVYDSLALHLERLKIYD